MYPIIDRPDKQQIIIIITLPLNIYIIRDSSEHTSALKN